MAKKRTFKEKQHAQIARQQRASSEAQPEAQSGVSYSLDSVISIKKSSVTGSSLLRIDSTYIVRDLVKTLFISGILFTLLIGIYFYLSYN
jgi:hypothetical protein